MVVVMAVAVGARLPPLPRDSERERVEVRLSISCTRRRLKMPPNRRRSLFFDGGVDGIVLNALVFV